MKRVFAVALLCCGVGAPPAVAQSALTLIKQAALPYAQGYINPLGNMLSAVFNSGQYHTADVSSFHVYASVQLTGALIPSADKVFSPDYIIDTHGNTSLPVELRDQTFHVHKTNVPTVLGGAADNMFLIDTTINGQLYQYGELPPGIDANYVPLVVPHVEIGSYMNTELLLRGAPPLETNSSIGKISFYGIGLRHELSSYFPALLVHVSVMVMYQHLGAGSLLAVDALNGAVLASINLPMVTLYGGLQAERARLHVHYEFQQPDFEGETVDLTAQSTNNFRATVGATVKLLLLYINGQITFAPVSTVGLGIGLRIPPSIF